MRLGHGGRHARQTGAMRSEKCVARRGRAWDGMRVIAACFTRLLQRCAGRTNMRFLLILQEVRAIGKTRNQFLVNCRALVPKACAFSGVSTPYSRTFTALPSRSTLRVSPSLMPTTYPVNCSAVAMSGMTITHSTKRTAADRLPMVGFIDLLRGDEQSTGLLQPV